MIVGSLLLILVAVTLLVLGLANGSSALLISSIAASLLAAVALVVGARQAAAGRIVGGDDDDALASAGSGAADASRYQMFSADTGSNPWSTSTAATATTSATAGPATASSWTTGPATAESATARGASEPAEATIPSQHVHRGSPSDADAPFGRPTGTGGRASGDQLPGDRLSGDSVAGDSVAGDSTAGDSDDEDVPPDEPAVQQVPADEAALVARLAATVLVVDGRPRYHLPGCDHLTNRDSESLPVREAVGLGFTPCALCQPDSALLSDVRRV